MECDFCSNPKVVHQYECMDFNAESKDAGVLYDGTKSTVGLTNLVLHSTNYWAACEACGKFIDKEDINGLLRHVAATLVDATGRMREPIRSNLIQHLHYSYELFFKNRIRVKDDVHDQR